MLIAGNLVGTWMRSQQTMRQQHFVGPVAQAAASCGAIHDRLGFSERSLRPAEFHHTQYA